MKKLLLCTCLVVACFFGYVGNVLYQQSLIADTAIVSIQFRNGFVLQTEKGIRTFRVIEVVCKGNEPLDVISNMSTLFLVEEKEEGISLPEKLSLVLTGGTGTADDSVSEQIRFPSRPAEFSYVNFLWTTRFYVLVADDGAIGMLDTMPTQKTVQNNPEILETLVPFPIPLKIDWQIPGVRNVTHMSWQLGTGGAPSVLTGTESAFPRISLYVGVRPHTIPEWW